jgi:hypothetical protein
MSSSDRIIGSPAGAARRRSEPVHIREVIARYRVELLRLREKRVRRRAVRLEEPVR